MGYQLINKGTLNVIKYEDIKIFFKAVDKPIIDGRYKASETGSYNFTGTHSLEEAKKFMKKGDRGSYDMVIKMKKLTDSLFRYDIAPRRKNVLSVEGYQPHVPNAIKGLPNSMFNTKTVNTDKKVIDVFYNSSISWDNSSNNLAFRGALLLSAMQTLESRGYSVNLYVGKISYDSSTRTNVGYIVNIKRSLDRLNVFKTAFYIVNPSFLRRISFRISEVEHDLLDITHNGYGRATNREKIREEVDNYILSNAVIYDDSVDININASNEHNLKEIKKLFKGKLEERDEQIRY